MSEPKKSIVDQPTHPLRPLLRRAPIYIRPRFFSFEFKTTPAGQIFSSHKLSPRLRVRLALDLLGVTVLLASLSLILLKTSFSTNISMQTEGNEFTTQCAARGRTCLPKVGVASVTPVPGATAPTTLQGRGTAAASPSAIASSVAIPDRRLTATPLPARSLPPAPQITPTSTPAPVTTPVAGPTPTPALEPLKAQPALLSISYSQKCLTGQGTSIIFSNTGTASLLWVIDYTLTSPGFTAVDSLQQYLLPPAQSATVTIFCTPLDIVGRYRVIVFFDGGSLLIPVIVGP